MQKLCVIKFGSSTVYGDNFFKDIARQLRRIVDLGWKPIIVTSGAEALGRRRYESSLGYKPKSSFTRNQSERRVLASLGQGEVFGNYKNALANANLTEVAQLLVSRDFFFDKARYMSLRETLESMADKCIIPIINNNDLASSLTLEFTDNDHLAAYIAGMLSADILVLVSDVDGIFDSDPTSNPEARKITRLPNRADKWPEIKIRREKISYGGIQSKLDATKLMASLGIQCRIVSHASKDFAIRALNKNTRIGTKMIPPKKKKMGGIRKWLVTGAAPKGILLISARGSKAVRETRRASLLAIGVESTYGDFHVGDVVSIRDQDFNLIGIGRVRYRSDDLRRLASDSNREERIVVHANDFISKSDDYFFSYDKVTVQEFCTKLAATRYSVAISNEFATVKYDDRPTALHRIKKSDHRAAWMLDVMLEEWVAFRAFTGSIDNAGFYGDHNQGEAFARLIETNNPLESVSWKPG